MDRAGGRVLVLRWVTAPAGRPRWEAVAAPSCSATVGSSGNWAERVEAPAGTKAAPRPWVGGLEAPLIARIIQYLGAGRLSDSPGRRRKKRAQLNWRTRTKRELVPFWNSWASLLPDLDPGNAVLSDPGRIHGVALVTRAWPSPVTRRRRERDALV